MELKNLPNDLREMNEEQFKEVFEFLKERTRNFSKFPPELILKNNQFILILRCSLGLSRSNFARKVGLNQETLRHVECNRKQNKIFTFSIAEKWAKKINEFLKKHKFHVDLENALLFWRNFKLKQFGEVDENFIKEFKKELKVLNLPKDLRKMNKNQFISLFKILKIKTKNFKFLRPEILITRSDLLLMLRCCLNLSQRQLAERLGTDKSWVRSIESGRRKIIHEGPANRWVLPLEKLLKNTKISLSKSLEFWKKFVFARDQNFPQIHTKRKPISLLTEEEFKKWFFKLKNLTHNFSTFSSDILFNQPQNILIFRLILGLTQKSFATKVGKSPRSIRKWEHLESKMKRSTAIGVMGKIETLFRKAQPSTRIEDVLLNFRIMKGMFGNRNLKSNFETGLKFAKNQKFSSIERCIIDILKEEGFECKRKIETNSLKTVEVHANVEGLKRILNVDFAIPSGKNPRIVIEAFDFNCKKKVISNSKPRVCHIDHRFQMIKLKNPSVKTILCIRFFGRPIFKEMVKKSLEMEILNTDHLIINDLNDLRDIIKNILSNQ